MYRVRGMLPVLVGAACAAAIGVTASAGGAQAATSTATTGVTYGGLTAQNQHLWIQLRPDRRAILSHEVVWYIPAARCTAPSGEPYWGYTFLGSQHQKPIRVTKGRFAATDVYRYSRDDAAIVEQYRIDGSITSAAITGRITATVTARLPDGQVNTCTLGSIRYRAVN